MDSAAIYQGENLQHGCLVDNWSFYVHSQVCDPGLCKLYSHPDR